MQFGRRQITLAAALVLLAVGGVLAAPGGADSTRAVRAADSLFAVTISGPTSVTLSRTVAPPRITFDVGVSYVGPTPAEGSPVAATMTMTLSQFEMNFGSGSIPAACGDPPPVNTPGVSRSCTFTIDKHSPSTSFTFQFSARPTGREGTGTTSISISTGASAGVATTFAYPPATTTETTETTTTTETPAAPATAAAAPTTTVTEAFTAATPPQAETVVVSPTAEAVTVGLAWPNTSDSFDVTNIALVQNGQVVARAPQSARKVRKLVVVKTRTATSLKVAIKGVTRGRLKFKIVARKLAKPTRVRATIRQTKHR